MATVGWWDPLRCTVLWCEQNLQTAQLCSQSGSSQALASSGEPPDGPAEPSGSHGKSHPLRVETFELRVGAVLRLASTRIQIKHFIAGKPTNKPTNRVHLKIQVMGRKLQEPFLLHMTYSGLRPSLLTPVSSVVQRIPKLFLCSAPVRPAASSPGSSSSSSWGLRQTSKGKRGFRSKLILLVVQPLLLCCLSTAK